jgi:hypothetical protein
MPWNIRGDYFESCSCDFLCPCPSSNLTARPTKGSCTFALQFHIDQGQFDGTTLDGLNFVVAGYTPGAMAEGNWTVGVIVDERAKEGQRNAIVGIASGEAGGPMSHLAPLVGKVAGVEVRPIEFNGKGMSWSGSVPGLLEQAIEGQGGANASEPMYLDNVGHPVNTRLALAKATRSHLHAFGMDWDDDSGRNNGHFAPFSWSG